MSGFTSEALEKKLADLNNSQQSIQTLSLWLIHHRKHNKLIVQTWFKELKKVKISRRLTFMYLANDVIQNSKKKGPEFSKEFYCVLKPAFEFVSKGADEKMLQCLERIITIWNDRNIYDSNTLAEFKKVVQSKSSESDKKRKDLMKKLENIQSKKFKSSDSGFNSNLVLLTQPEVELPIKGEDVDSEELIRSLKGLENTASSDASVREKIAQLPPDVSDITLLYDLRDKKNALFEKEVEEACLLLNEYNNRLAKELEHRKQITIKLGAYYKYQKEIQLETEKKMTEYCERLNKVIQVKNELKSHLRNFPDLSLLPSVTDGLAPLPPPGDLFIVKSPSKSNSDKNIYEPSSLNNDLNLDMHDSKNSFNNLTPYVPTSIKFNQAGGIATCNSSSNNIKN